MWRRPGSSSAQRGRALFLGLTMLATSVLAGMPMPVSAASIADTVSSAVASPRVFEPGTGPATSVTKLQYVLLHPTRTTIEIVDYASKRVRAPQGAGRAERRHVRGRVGRAGRDGRGARPGRWVPVPPHRGRRAGHVLRRPADDEGTRLHLPGRAGRDHGRHRPGPRRRGPRRHPPATGREDREPRHRHSGCGRCSSAPASRSS